MLMSELGVTGSEEEQLDMESCVVPSPTERCLGGDFQKMFQGRGNCIF